MSRLKRTGLVFFSLFAAYLLVGFFALPPVLRSVLRSKLSQALHRPVWVQQARVNPLALSVTLRGVTVGEPDGAVAFVHFDELYVNAECASVWRRGVVVREIRLTRPYVHVERLEAGKYNFSDLLAPKPGAAPKPKEAGAPPRLALGNIQIAGGALDFEDEPVGKRHRIRDLSLTVPFLSNFPAYVEAFVEPALSGRVNGKAFSLKGDSKPFANSLETSLSFELRDLEIPPYLAYLPKKPRARLSSARLDTRLHMAYAQYRDRGPTLTLSGDAALRQVALDDETGTPLLRLPKASISFGPVEVFSRSVRVSTVRVEGPEARLTSDRKGRWNWAAVKPEPGPEPPPAEQPAQEQATEGAKPLSYRVDDVALSGGKLTFEDGSLPRPFRTAVAPIDLSVRGLSNAEGEAAKLALDLKTDAGEALTVRSDVGLAPLKAVGQLGIEGVRLAKYAPYYGRKVLLDLAGTLAASTRFDFQKAETARVRLAGFALSLSGLSAARTGEKAPFLRLASLDVADTSLDLAEHGVTLGSLSLRKGDLSLHRTPNGVWNFQGLTPAAPVEPRPRKPAKPEPPGKPWVLDLSRLAVRDLGVQVADETTPHPAHLALSKISVEGSGLTNRPGRRGRLSLSADVNRRGSLSAKGSLGLTPVTAALDLAVKSVDLTPFQPYVEDKLRALITSGAVSTTGSLTLGPGKAGKPVAGYRGDLLVSGFSASDAVSGEPVVAFDSLAVTAADLRQEPPTAKVDGISLTDFTAAVTVNSDGSVNLREVVEAPSGSGSAAPAQGAPASAPPPPPASAAGPAPVVQVNTVTLQGGKVRFTDRHVKPAYGATLVDLGGRVSGLASMESSLADVDVRAKLDDAPLSITGKINPLIKSPYVDLKVSFQGADLSPTTPYAGRYVGYTVEKGKLFLDVQYKIAQRKIDAQNLIVLDQFFLGDKVESPQATKLPVKLGLALLRDRNGQIRLDLPVSGNLDDPQFRVGKIVWQAILNILEKAVLSPFALLGSLFGAGPELGYLEFPPGSAEVNEVGAKKVATLAKALKERPALKLEVEGRGSPEEDRKALSELFFLRKLKTQKAKEIVREGQDVASVDSIALSKEEIAKYLPPAYKVEKFPKPRNALGFEKDIPLEEKEKLLRSHIQVTDDDVGILARERAEAVKAALLKTALVGADRVFVVEGKGLGKEREGKVSESRVDFGLE